MRTASSPAFTHAGRRRELIYGHQKWLLSRKYRLSLMFLKADIIYLPTLYYRIVSR